MRPAACLFAPLLLALAWPCAGQDLAAAASREKERREKAGKKAKTFTNDDLSKGTPQASPAPAAATSDGRPMDSDRLRRLSGGGASGGASPPSTPGTPPAAGAGCEGAGCGGADAVETPTDEAGWRRRAQSLRDAVTRAEADVARIEKALGEVRGGQSQPLPIDAMRQVPPDPLTRPPDAERLGGELERAKAAVVAARQALADFEEEARRASVPPGWLR